MANPNQSVRTCIVKVDLKCCSGCQKKAKTKLQSISGVNEAEYNQEKELLIVTGDVEPMTLVHKLTKWGRKSELVSVKYHKLNDQISDAADEDEEEDTSSSSASSSNASSNPDPKPMERDSQEIIQMMKKKKKGLLRKYLLLGGCFSKESEVVKPFTIPRNYHLPSKFENDRRPGFSGTNADPATSAWRHPHPQMHIHQQPQFPMMTGAAMQYNGYPHPMVQQHPQYPMTGAQMAYNGYMFGSAPPPTQPYGIMSKEALAVNPRLHYQ